MFKPYVLQHNQKFVRNRAVHGSSDTRDETSRCHLRRSTVEKGLLKRSVEDLLAVLEGPIDMGHGRPIKKNFCPANVRTPKHRNEEK